MGGEGREGEREIVYGEYWREEVKLKSGTRVTSWSEKLK